MPRPPEIAADARALYGPPSVRPAASAMGDGALWVDPGDNQSVWQVQSGNWVRIALPPVDDDSAVPAGVPLLRGPYVVDYTDIPHDGDKMTLWTPQVGDVLLHLFCDYGTATQWDTGVLNVGPGVDSAAGKNILTTMHAGKIGLFTSFTGDLDVSHWDATQRDGAGTTIAVGQWVFHGTDPMQVQLDVAGGPDPAAGHVEIFALVARPLAP